MKPTGGPAFPVNVPYRDEDGRRCLDPGMSLRDYFAAKAMQGMIIAVGMEGAVNKEMEVAEEQVALDAYKMADAMIAEGEKE